MATTLHGKNAIVYLQGSGTDAEELIESAEWSIDIDFDLDPDTAFGDNWETQLKGILRWSGSLSGNFDLDSNLAFDGTTQTGTTAAASRKLYIYPDRANATQYYYGNVWPRLSVGGGIGGRATMTGAFQGSGELAKN